MPGVAHSDFGFDGMGDEALLMRRMMEALSVGGHGDAAIEMPGMPARVAAFQKVGAGAGPANRCLMFGHIGCNDQKVTRQMKHGKNPEAIGNVRRSWGRVVHREEPFCGFAFGTFSASFAAMQFVRDIHARRRAEGRPVISFEFFPPKTEEGDRALLEKTIPALMRLKPDFCSVTYGAGGGTREKTLMIVDRIQREHQLTTVMHLTCVNATVAEVTEVIEQARKQGVKNILALRGDPPGGNGVFQKTQGGFEFSYQLVAHIKKLGGFSIGTAGFPEGHIANQHGKHVDWKHLKNKIDSGADFVVTQLFFDNADFFEFRDHLVKELGVQVPIFPGILPVQSASQTKRIATLCGSKIPAAMLAELEKHANDDDAAMQFGIEYASRQCAELLRGGVPGLHIYTLNKAHPTTEVLKNLKLA
jgi:methylenetetrahydrofolate reductase (NADPH)